MGKATRLHLIYRKGLGPKKKLEDEVLPLSPGAVSLYAGEDSSKQIEKQGTKRKRSRLSELEKLMTDQDEGKNVVKD